MTHKSYFQPLFTLLCVLSLTAFISVSCDDSSAGSGENESQLTTFTVESLEAVGIGRGGIGGSDYTLYSLANNKVVTDSASTNWDIGFSGANIIINNTASGPGQGGAVVLDVTFDDVTKAPEDSFYKTDTDTTFAVSWPEWAKYTGTTGTPQHAVLAQQNVTIVVRTADGAHFAKIHIINWYKGNPQPEDLNTDPFKRNDGYYTFKYAIQKNGSRNLN